MKLTIFAATGGIGRQLLEQAIAAGHDVTAVVRSPEKLSGEAVRVVRADLAAPDPAALESAVERGRRGPVRPRPAVERRRRDRGPGHGGHRGGDAGNTRPPHRRGQRRAGRHRAVAGPPPAAEARPGRRVLHAPPVQPRGQGRCSARSTPIWRRWKTSCATAAWTGRVVRPPRLTGKPGTGRYRTAYGQNVRGGWIVPRADVAHLMLRVRRAARDDQASHRGGQLRACDQPVLPPSSRRRRLSFATCAMRSYGTGWDSGNFSVLFAARDGPRRRSRASSPAGAG